MFLDIESILIVVGAIILMLAYELRTKKAGLTGNIFYRCTYWWSFPTRRGCCREDGYGAIAAAAMAGLATLYGGEG